MIGALFSWQPRGLPKSSMDMKDGKDRDPGVKFAGKASVPNPPHLWGLRMQQFKASDREALRDVR